MTNELPIQMTEDEARATHEQHGCIVAQLNGGPNNDPKPILCGISESEAHKHARRFATGYPDRSYGIFKLTRIIESESSQ